MVNFPGPGTVFGFGLHEAGGFGDEAGEDVDADGEVGAPDEADFLGGDDAFDFVEMLEPAGGADDQRYAELGDALDVAGHGGWDGELDSDVDGGEVVSGEALA